ncbi:MAG: phosphatidylserine decarboxylase [Gammaproteobacteria bacterium]|nr:phosphatidylserine decarboxylase [Gammaproteobacteria bacterium]
MTSSNKAHSSELTKLFERLFALLQYCLPHHLLSQLMYWLTRSEWPLLKDGLIKAVIRLYKINLHEAEESNPLVYPSFNAFFTRQLKANARPIAQQDRALISPVDGTISQLGDIKAGRIFQAKGQDYALSELLGGDDPWCDAFADGNFATIYLSPRDYHRIHMPMSGQLRLMRHIPGRLFSVSPSTTRNVPRLFSRNERLVNLFETDRGPMAVIMVGAIFVASMDTVWAGTVAPSSRRISDWQYGDEPSSPVQIGKGDEMGRFNMGSTVILLFGKDCLQWSEQLKSGESVEMGEQIALLSEPSGS